MADLIGQMLGQYQIIEQIGMGGMATVYKAYQASMDRFVAVKVLPRQLAEDPTFFGRFEQEARTIAKLENKHILPVYDNGEFGGYTYLVMRYVGSGTLKGLIDRSALSLPDAVDYFTQIAEALQYAHDHGVVHRDVKPSNVLLGEGKQCYLTDFGIAKLAAGSAHFTGTGAVIGTPAYMSPEQCSGLPADSRSDIYSLGIVLYEMLTGRVPFQAETPVAVVMMHVTEPLPLPRSINPTIPELVEKTILRGLAKDPEHRFQSAREFADTLRAAVEEFTQQQTMLLGGGSARPVGAVTPPVGAATQFTDQVTPLPGAPPTTPAAPTVPMQPVRRLPLGWIGLAALAVIALVAAGIWLSRDKNDTTSSSVTPSVEVLATAVPTAAPTTRPTSAPTAVPTTQPSPAPTVVPSPAPTTPPTPVPTEIPKTVWTVFTSTRARQDSDRQLVVTGSGLWMNSAGGLTHWNRDGSYQTYTSADGLPYNNIQTLAADSTGAVWIGGSSEQIARAQVAPDGTFNIESFDNTNSGLRSGSAMTFMPGSDGTLLAGTYQSLIESWDGQRWTVPDFPTVGDPALDAVGDRVFTLLRSKDGTLWAGGPAGMAYLPPQGQAWVSVAPPAEIQAMNASTIYFYGFYEDPLDGMIWTVIVTQTDGWTIHLFKFTPPATAGDPVTWEAAPAWIPEVPRSLLRASDGALWIVIYNTVLRIDTTTGSQAAFDSNQGIPGDQYFDIVEDTDGTLWMTTDTALVHYDGGRWTPYYTKNELPLNDVESMAEAADGTLWFAGAYETIFTYDGTTWETLDYFDGDLFDIAVQGDVAWVASEHGLIRWENGASKRYTTEDGLTSDFVTSVELDPNKPAVLWVGTDLGLNALNTADGTITTWTREKDGLIGPQIAVMAFDPQGVLWIGTGYDTNLPDSGGPGLMTLKDGTLTPIAQRGSPLREEDQRVQTIAFDAQGKVWIGTNEYVYRLDGERWRRFVSADGAPENDNIGSILAGPDNLLVMVPYQGLYEYHADSGWRLLGYGHTGGGYIYGLYRTSDGALWFLTETGIARVEGDLGGG